MYLPSKHDSKLFRDPLEYLLDGGGVADECGRHLEAARGYVASRHLHVVRDPFHEVTGNLNLIMKGLYVALNMSRAGFG